MIQHTDVLNKLGWDSEWQAAFAAYAARGLIPGRIISEHRDRFFVRTDDKELWAKLPGRVYHHTDDPTEFPKVGDWVALEPIPKEDKAAIQAILPRRTRISRKAAGKKDREQILATNVDTIFIVAGLDRVLNHRKLHRFIVVVKDGGAHPVIILNKTDVAVDWPVILEQVQSQNSDVPVFAVSAKSGDGLAQLHSLFRNNSTVAFLGPSGAGKSTLINAIVGAEILLTKQVREKDRKGRHATTVRELILLADGGVLIDTPGIRELGLIDAEDGLSETFSEIEEHAQFCHFSDCSHTHEIKCAVREAVHSGTIAKDRYDSYIKMQKELNYQDTKNNKWALIQKKKKERTLYKNYTPKKNR